MFFYYCYASFVVYFGADFISGLFHWIEDTYLDTNSSNPFIRYIAQQNEIHHKEPMDFLQCNAFENIVTTFPFYVLLMVLNRLTFNSSIIYCTFTLGLFSNIIHRWTHMSNRPPVVTVLQQLYILQRPELHKLHHYAGGTTTPRYVPGSHYCVVSNISNHILEYISFWRRLEFVIYKLTGLHPLWYN
jgi:hypothetical protein